MRVNPWIAVVLIALALVGTIVFAVLRIPEGGVTASILALGVALLQGTAHQETKSELVTLRKSIAPPREPSMHDIEVPKDA